MRPTQARFYTDFPGVEDTGLYATSFVLLVQKPLGQGGQNKHIAYIHSSIHKPVTMVDAIRMVNLMPHVPFPSYVYRTFVFDAGPQSDSLLLIVYVHLKLLLTFDIE